VHVSTDGLLDLRVTRRAAPEPWRLSSVEIASALADLAGGTPYREALERLLLACSDEHAERLMQLQRESRGAWLLLLRGPRGGRTALLLGNGLSGTSVPLCNAGFEVTLFEPCAERLRLAQRRNEALAPGRTRALHGGDGIALPFGDASFDLVLQEDGPPRREHGWGHDLGECRRVCAGELVLVADNRYGYKRSSGRRGVFHVPGPLEYVRNALVPRDGELSLGAYRRALRAPGFERPSAFALYPHAQEFTFVVGLDQRTPRLALGPKERENRLKVLGNGLGLFPWLTPSYALVAARADARAEPARIERILAELARRIGEPEPCIEELVATRGNTALVQTCAKGDPHARRREDGRGRWTIHVPLSPAQASQVRNHCTFLGRLRREFPRVPVPEPLFVGEIDGVFLSCERRLSGWTAPQLTGNREAAARMFADAARHLAELVVEPARPLDQQDFEKLVGARFERVARRASVPSTLENLTRWRERARESLIGLAVPRVVQHADLRSKHVQVQPDGSVLGYLDWGSAEPADLPYFDLLHLIVHERKQEARLRASDAWRIVRERAALRPHESAALDDYARRLELDERVLRAIEQLYPVIVGAMAEKHWDYSRPRWLHRQFGI